MTSYQHVLAAVDLTEEAPQVLEHASQVAIEHGAQLRVLTVIRPVTYAYAGLDSSWVSKEMANFETDSEVHARKKLAELAAHYGVPATNTHVFIGAPAGVIKEQAEAMDVDLIVLGTHGRHGLGLILAHQYIGQAEQSVIEAIAGRN